MAVQRNGIRANYRSLADTIQKNLDGFKQNRVRVGAIGGTSSEMLTIVGAHEYGSKNMPMRSFLRLPIQEHISELQDLCDNAARAHISGENGWRVTLDKLGIQALHYALESFTNGGYGQWRGLKPATVARKGHSTILVHTGRLRNSVRYEISER